MLFFLLGNRGNDLEALLRSSVGLFGEGYVLVPSLKRVRLSVFNHAIGLLGLVFTFYNYHRNLGIGILVASVCFLYPYSFFYHVRMKACQTWMVYTTITKNTSSWSESLEVTARHLWSLRIFAMIELAIAVEKGAANKREFSLARMLASALEAVFDVVEDFLLPAIVIEQKSLNEVIPRLEQLKLNVPASLTGAFGIDLFGKVASFFLFVVQLPIVLTGIALGYLAAGWVPATLQTVIYYGGAHGSPRIPGAPIFMLPIMIAIFSSSLLGRLLSISVSSIKDTYFSIFYTSINRPLEIRENLRDSLTHYLMLEDQSYAPTPIRPEQAQQVLAIDKFFQENITKHPLERIHAFLLSKGYPEELICDAMTKYKKPA